MSPAVTALGAVAVQALIPGAFWRLIVELAISANGVPSFRPNAPIAVIHHKLPETDASRWTHFSRALDLLVSLNVLTHVSLGLEREVRGRLLRQID